MTKMGFDNKWIKLIMSCINFVSYYVLINGVAHECITPTRGLRQGDPLHVSLMYRRTNGFDCGGRKDKEDSWHLYV